MKGVLSKSLNIFHKNSNNNENNSKRKKLITDNRENNNNNIIKKRNSKNVKRVKLKTFLNEIDNNLDSDVSSENHIIRIPSKKLINRIKSKKHTTKSNFNLEKFLTPKIKPKLKLNSNREPNKEGNQSFRLEKTESEHKDNNGSENNNKYNSQYFEYRQKEYKSSTIDSFKKRYNLYKEKLFTKKRVDKKRLSFLLNKTNIFLNEDSNKKIFNSRNTILSYLEKKNNCNTNKSIKRKDKNIFKDKSLFSKKNNNITNHIINNKNIILFTERKTNNNLLFDGRNKNNDNLNIINSTKFNNNINTINSSSKQIKSYIKQKKSSNFLMNLPKIKTLKSQKSLNLGLPQKKKNFDSIKNIIDKNEINTKKKSSIKKTTTINIYNNKINNINNIILHDKDVKNDFEGKDGSIYNKQEDESYFSKTKNNIYITETQNNTDDLNAKTSSEVNNKYKNKKLKINLKDSTQKLSVNYTRKFLGQFHFSRKKWENINVTEKNIRKKILKLNSIIKGPEIVKNLKKIKEDTTLVLFEELIKKISKDLEEEEKKYNNKKSMKFNQKCVISGENEYINIVHKKTLKIIKKSNKIIYDSKNKLIQIYQRNIIHYSKISINECKYFFFKYLYNNYFNYISQIIFSKKENHKKHKNYNLLNLYSANKNRYNNSNSINSSFTKKSENYFHSIFLQYLLMERDKIQKYSLNNRYIDKTINQIKNLIEKVKKELNDNKKTGDIKINFIVNNYETNINNAHNNKYSPNKKLNNRDSIQFTFLNIKKTEYSDTDRYDSKSGYDTQGIFPGKIRFNYKSIKDKKENNNKFITDKQNLLIKKKTFNNEMFRTNYSNFLNNNINTNNNSNKKIETKKNIENKYNLAMIDKEKIEKKYIHNITKNNDYFFKRKKSVKNKKRHEIITPKKEINFLKGNYLFKNMIDYRTDEIKTIIKRNIKSPIEMLFYQIKEHDFDEFCELFERKQIDLNARNPDNDTFLIYAVKCKAMNFVQYLLKRGIDVNLDNKYGNTALHYAFCDQNYELADVLLQHGADEFKINVFGQTPWQCLGQKKFNI